MRHLYFILLVFNILNVLIADGQNSSSASYTTAVQSGQLYALQVEHHTVTPGKVIEV